jgi:hypothetical protein
VKCWLLGLTHGIQGGNEIGDRGAELIGQGLKVNRSLQTLHLVRLFVYCLFLWAMQGEGGERAGRGSAALTRVLQERNRIGDAGAAGLGEGLKVNSSLQMLFFCSC